MPLKKTDAIILRSIKQGETSKILSLFSPASGKISVMAKGARSAKSRFGGTLEPLNHISLVYYEKENRDLHILSQADILDSFANIKSDLHKISLASAVCELINQLETSGEANHVLFQLHLKTLQAMNQQVAQPLNLFQAFLLKLFKVLGFQPDFSVCMNCRKSGFGDVTVNLSNGGYFCNACKDLGGEGMALSEGAVRTVIDYQRLPMAQLTGRETSETIRKQMGKFLVAYLQYHLDGYRELRSIRFYKNLDAHLH